MKTESGTIKAREYAAFWQKNLKKSCENDTIRE